MQLLLRLEDLLIEAEQPSNSANSQILDAIGLGQVNPSTWLAGRTGFLAHPALATPLLGSPLDSRGHPNIPKERSTSSRDWCRR